MKWQRVTTSTPGQFASTMNAVICRCLLSVTRSTACAATDNRQITAFIVEANWPGVEVVTRCHFMGLKALYKR